MPRTQQLRTIIKTMKTVTDKPKASPTALIVAPSASRKTRIQTLLDYIDRVKDQPMEPAEFASHWVDHPLDARGYRRVCNEVIGNALNLDAFDVGSWGKNYGKMPAYVPKLLRLADIVKRLQEFGICRPKTPQSWEQSLPLPRSWPQPFYKLSDKVIHKKNGGFGTILGLGYLPESNQWCYVVKLHPSSPCQPGERVVFGQSELSWW